MPDRDEALRQAVADVDVDEVARLLEAHAPAIDDDLVRGVIASALGNYEAHAALLRVLFAGGADVDVVDDDFKTTALMLAADAGDLEQARQRGLKRAKGAPVGLPQDPKFAESFRVDRPPAGLQALSGAGGGTPHAGRDWPRGVLRRYCRAMKLKVPWVAVEWPPPIAMALAVRRWKYSGDVDDGRRGRRPAAHRRRSPP